MLDGKDILKTLIELLEVQEEIKVKYELGGEKNDKAVQPSDRGA